MSIFKYRSSLGFGEFYNCCNIWKFDPSTQTYFSNASEYHIFLKLGSFHGARPVTEFTISFLFERHEILEVGHRRSSPTSSSCSFGKFVQKKFQIQMRCQFGKNSSLSGAG